MALHILSSRHSSTVETMQKSIQENDTLLLLGDALYLLPTLTLTAPPYVRIKDMEQRGLTFSSQDICLITDAQWVALTLKHQPIFHWYH